MSNNNAAVGGVSGSDSSDTDSQEESKHPNYHRKQKKKQSQSSAAQQSNPSASVPFTADNLIERPGNVLSSLFSQFSGGSNSNMNNHGQSLSGPLKDRSGAAAFQIDSSSA